MSIWEESVPSRGMASAKALRWGVVEQEENGSERRVRGDQVWAEGSRDPDRLGDLINMTLNWAPRERCEQRRTRVGAVVVVRLPVVWV